MRLTTRTRYGTRMLLDLAEHGRDNPVRIGDIAARQVISIKYLEKLTRPLKRAGLIKSVRGSKGGHLLAKAPGEISLSEIVRALEGDFQLVKCWDENSCCPRMSACRTSRLWGEVSATLDEKLASISLLDLLCDSVRGANAGGDGRPSLCGAKKS
ncbi:MAG: RrF2 family transcriptional regulator [Desulfovibrionaceae bacterium]|nr:RrF2 family transcriptional regulator [Desulfovibrionaceae bacterium]MBF0514494.1 RrF2 family transcriptional regulator [Desulfovibrionaceae bacterium]